MIIAIGDLHGNFDALETLTKSLHETYGIFTDEMLLKPDNELVSTGDSIDRGNKSTSILDYYISIDENNDNFFPIMGNHELLALADFDKTLNPQEYFFTIHGSNGGLAFISEFDPNDYESAFEKYREAMSKHGKYGKWMRKLLTHHITEISGKRILFTHGDIPDSLGSDSRLLSYVAKVEKHLDTSTQLVGGSEQKYNAELIMRNSIFWNRRFETITESDAETLVKDLEVDYIVTGHTPHEGILNYHNRIIDIDCMMWAGEKPQALVIKEDGIYSFSDKERLIIGFDQQ